MGNVRCCLGDCHRTDHLRCDRDPLLHALPHCDIRKQHFIPSGKVLAQICSIGMSSGINQIAVMIVQIVMNNLLKHYGAQSVYGESIPIACAGIVMKVNQLYFSIVIGLAQGSQPIESFNYGAKQYKRVTDAFLLAASVGAVVSIISFLLFQLFPRQILGLFGSGSEEYFEFGVNYFRTFLFFTWLNFLQPISSMFFSSIGKAYKGTFLSLTRQFLFLLPLFVALPHFSALWAYFMQDRLPTFCPLQSVLAW